MQVADQISSQLVNPLEHRGPHRRGGRHRARVHLVEVGRNRAGGGADEVAEVDGNIGDLRGGTACIHRLNAEAQEREDAPVQQRHFLANAVWLL